MTNTGTFIERLRLLQKPWIFQYAYQTNEGEYMEVFEKRNNQFFIKKEVRVWGSKYRTGSTLITPERRYK